MASASFWLFLRRRCVRRQNTVPHGSARLGRLRGVQLFTPTLRPARRGGAARSVLAQSTGSAFLLGREGHVQAVLGALAVTRRLRDGCFGGTQVAVGRPPFGFAWDLPEDLPLRRGQPVHATCCALDPDPEDSMVAGDWVATLSPNNFVCTRVCLSPQVPLVCVKINSFAKTSFWWRRCAGSGPVSGLQGVAFLCMQRWCSGVFPL